MYFKNLTEEDPNPNPNPFPFLPFLFNPPGKIIEEYTPLPKFTNLLVFTAF